MESIRPRVSGELFLYVNDAVSPFPPFDFFFAPGRIGRKSEALANYLVDFVDEEQLIHSELHP